MNAAQGAWPVEAIPDEGKLFYRVHRSYIQDDGNLRPGVFKDKGDDGAMSTNWEKYSTARDARQRARTPMDNGVVSLVAGDVRGLSLEVIHSPIETDRSHASVKGNKSAEVRVKLLELALWEIRV